MCVNFSIFKVVKLGLPRIYQARQVALHSKGRFPSLFYSFTFIATTVLCVPTRHTRSARMYLVMTFDLGDNLYLQEGYKDDGALSFLFTRSHSVLCNSTAKTRKAWMY